MTILFDSTAVVNTPTTFGAGILPARKTFVPTEADEAWRLEQIAREEYEAWLDMIYAREIRAEQALIEMGWDRHAK